MEKDKEVKSQVGAMTLTLLQGIGQVVVHKHVTSVFCNEIYRYMSVCAYFISTYINSIMKAKSWKRWNKKTVTTLSGILSRSLGKKGTR